MVLMMTIITDKELQAVFMIMLVMIMKGRITDGAHDDDHDNYRDKELQTVFMIMLVMMMKGRITDGVHDDDHNNYRDRELQTVFTTLLGTHFLTPETSSTTASGAAHHLGLHDDKVQNRMQGEELMRGVIASLVCVTVELNNRLRSMFLPTAQRCHYIFTARDLANLFR